MEVEKKSEDNFEISCLCDTNKSWCLNLDDSYPVANLWDPKPELFIRSDCDEQLLIHVEFQQRIKLRSLCFMAPPNANTDQLPAKIKIFIDQPTMDFDAAEDNKPVQTIELTKNHYTSETHVLLQFVKFQNLGSITFFIETNLGDEDQTILSNIKFFGYPLDTCNVAKIKKC